MANGTLVFDPTGTAESHYFIDEEHGLNETNDQNPNSIPGYIFPTYGTFFKDKLKVKGIDNTGNEVLLSEGADFELSPLVSTTTIAVGKSVYGYVKIIDTNAYDTIKISYQATGVMPIATAYDMPVRVEKDIVVPAPHVLSIEGMDGDPEFLVSGVGQPPVYLGYDGSVHKLYTRQPNSDVKEYITSGGDGSCNGGIVLEPEQFEIDTQSVGHVEPSTLFNLIRTLAFRSTGTGIALDTLLHPGSSDKDLPGKIFYALDGSDAGQTVEITVSILFNQPDTAFNSTPSFNHTFSFASTGTTQLGVLDFTIPQLVVPTTMTMTSIELKRNVTVANNFTGSFHLVSFLLGT